MEQTMTKTECKTVNGVNVTELFDTIEAVKGMPTLAKFKFRVQNEWMGGGHNRTRVGDFHGVHEEHPHKSTFVLEADEPPLLLGQDRGPNPVEYLLAALVSCVTSALVYHAAAKGIRIDEIESRVEGDIDIQGFLGLDDSVPRGYKDIRIKFKIKADVPEEELMDLVNLGPSYSPVFDTVTRAVPVHVSLDQ